MRSMASGECLWWDEVDGERRVLVVVSARTVEVWDATEPRALRQLLTMDCDDRLVCARVVNKKWIGVLLPSSLVVYSLSAVSVVEQRYPFSGVGCRLESSGKFVVVVSLKE